MLFQKNLVNFKTYNDEYLMTHTKKEIPNTKYQPLKY